MDATTDTNLRVPEAQLSSGWQPLNRNRGSRPRTNMHNPTPGPQPPPHFSFEPLGQSFADTPDSPSQLHQHQHQCPQFSYHELLNELRTTTTNQTELITKLKIRVVVLESELKRAGKDKDDVVNSLGILAGALTRASVNSAFEPDIPAPER